MTNDDLKAIQERAEKATEPPTEGSAWLVVETTDDGFCIPGVAYLMGVNAEANADFIAHAREDIPMLSKALAEAGGKLKLMVELYTKHDSRSHFKDDQQCAACRRDAILGGSE